MVLNFTKDPSSKSLRPLIELYGRDRDRMRVEAEILERQLKHRLATFAQPDDATVRKAITKNEQRVLAVYLHVRSGGRSARCRGPGGTAGVIRRIRSVAVNRFSASHEPSIRWVHLRRLQHFATHMVLAVL
jgi:hypothetical protein